MYVVTPTPIWLNTCKVVYILFAVFVIMESQVLEEEKEFNRRRNGSRRIQSRKLLSCRTKNELGIGKLERLDNDNKRYFPNKTVYIFHPLLY